MNNKSRMQKLLDRQNDSASYYKNIVNAVYDHISKYIIFFTRQQDLIGKSKKKKKNREIYSHAIANSNKRVTNNFSAQLCSALRYQSCLSFFSGPFQKDVGIQEPCLNSMKSRSERIRIQQFHSSLHSKVCSREILKGFIPYFIVDLWSLIRIT